MNSGSIFENINTVYKRISRAAHKADRNPADITLVAVTKTVGAGAIREAIDAGVRTFGENRVQEARDKIAALKATTETVHWHLIGNLQRNKAKYAVRLFDLIQSVDSRELAADLDSHAGRIGKRQDVLVEVKLSPEDTKYGVEETRLPELLSAITEAKNLNLRGLMTIPPFFDDPDEARPFFRRLRALRDALEADGFRLPELSMGMSHDFEIAVEEGATMVRIGTAIFGERR